MRITCCVALIVLGLAMSPVRSPGLTAARTGQAPAAPQGMAYMLLIPMLARDGGSPATTLDVVSGIVIAAPTCPVEQIPPDPRCAPRAVTNAVLLFTDQHGRQVAQAVSDAGGHFAVTLPPGVYTLIAQPVDGLIDAPAPQAIVVNGNLVLTVQYDTGIR